MDIWQLLKGETEHQKLRRIEAGVVSISILLLIVYVLNLRRVRSRNSFLEWFLRIFNDISDNLVTYTIGLMQSATSTDSQIHVSIWAILLLILSNSYYDDFDRSKVYHLKRQVGEFMNYLLTGVLNLSMDYNRVSLVVWVLWLLHLIKFVLRSWILELADASYHHGKNSRLIADYMSYEHEMSQPHECNPATMSGYKYLVHGEGKSKLEPEERNYLVKLKVGNEKKLITLEKVWQCQGRLLDSNGDPDCKLKDLCLSFALYKLIRRRFDDLHPPPAADQPKTHALFREGLLTGEDYTRVFRVIEIELAFLKDYFQTLFPAMLFTRYVVSYTLILVGFGVSWWLLVLVAHLYEGCTFEFFITIVLVCMVILKEMLEVLDHVCSDWNKVLLLCTYVEHPSWHDNALVEMLLRFVCGLNFVKHWPNKICQYNLLKSFRHDSVLRCSRQSTKRKFKTIKVPEVAKNAIFRSLRGQISSGRLSNGMVSLQQNQVDQELSWACEMSTNVHTILVWHVATCLCEINMSLRHGAAGRSVRHCFQPTSFILNWRNLNGARLQDSYVVASSLSQYCAYLLVFCPKLLRYHGLIIDFIIERTVAEAQEILKVGRARSMKDLHDKLWDAVGVADRREEESRDNVMMMGARLGRTLMEEIGDEERIWKVLAEFWAEMVVYIAPCANIGAHRKHLNTGGEFLTHLWALLHHAGFDEVDDEIPVQGVAKEEEKPTAPAIVLEMCQV